MVRGPEVYWMSHWDEWLPLAFMSILVRGEGVNALINTAPPMDLDAVHKQLPDAEWAKPGNHPSRLVRAEKEVDLGEALLALGVEPSEVTHVILTPLELYTTGQLETFNNAKICVSKRGWLHFHSTHSHPHDVRYRSFSRETLIHLVTDDWNRVELLEDEATLMPGLRTWWAGVHHRASMVVEIDTAIGTVCVSDAFFYYANVEDGKLLGLNENMYEAPRTNGRVLSVADHIIPIHDPEVFLRYDSGVVAR